MMRYSVSIASLDKEVQMKSVGRALEVLECVSDLQPIGVSDIARTLGEPKTSVQRALDTLASGRWIARDDTNTALWVIAVRTALLGRNFAGKFDVQEVALSYMETLRQETQETIHLAVPREASMILIERLESPHPLRYVEPLGEPASIFRTATGKSVLAYMAPERLNALLSSHTGEITERGDTLEEFLDELAAIRERGFSTTSRWRSEVYATASVITSSASGEPIAALSISVPATRMTERLKSRHAELVTRAAKDISAHLL